MNNTLKHVQSMLFNEYPPCQIHVKDDKDGWVLCNKDATYKSKPYRNGPDFYKCEEHAKDDKVAIKLEKEKGSGFFS